MRSPLRLVHLTTVDMSLALLLATELRMDVEAGFDTIGASAGGNFVHAVLGLGARHMPLPLTRSWAPICDVVGFISLWRVLRRLRPDILHTHTPKAGVLGRIAGRLVGVPVVVNTCHGLYLREGDGVLKRTLVVAVEAFAAMFSDFELYQNENDRRILRRFVPMRRSRTVGNGIDLTRFRRDEEARARVRAELDVADDVVLVGGVGRVVWEKGVSEFGKLAHTLADRARFVWAGPVEDQEACESLPINVQCLGMRDDMPEVYSALDVFVLPSHREGFSRSAMEAAACGCALVLSDIRGCRELGRHGEHLLLVPPHDATALIQAVTELLDEPESRQALSAAGTERAMECYDQGAVARASIETYRDVARRKGLVWADHPSLNA